MNLAFVVQRYGDDVAGGAEALCRQTARALVAAGHHVTILTTTARDYLHWSPHYPAGSSTDGSVEVRRFDADPADPVAASRLGREVALGWGGWDREVAWATAQGPVSRGLLDELATSAGDYDVVALWTYLYATTQLAMPLVRERAILVPTAHDEPMLRFGITRGLIAMAAGLAYLTPEERCLVRDLHGAPGQPDEIVGAGLTPTSPGDPLRARQTFALPDRFALYLGRVDPGKGTDRLFVMHAAYRAVAGELGLVVAGRRPEGVHVPDQVTQLGFVDDRSKADLLAAAEVLVLPSVNESLSLVLMEAWQAGCPTLANGRSDVLAAQTARSGGGLVYLDESDYVRQLTRLASDPALRAEQARAGQEWAAGETWQNVIGRWESLFERVRSGRAVGT